LHYLNAKKDVTKNKIQLVCILQECKERRGTLEPFRMASVAIVLEQQIKHYNNESIAHPYSTFMEEWTC
jgi:hypothetical protein